MMVRVVSFFIFLLCCTSSALHGQQDTLKPFKKDNLWGYQDTKGNEIVAPRFSHAEKFSYGFAIVYTTKGKQFLKCSVIDTTGKEILPYAEGEYKILPGTPIVFLYRDYGSDKAMLYDSTGRVIYSTNGCYLARYRNEFVASPDAYHVQNGQVTVFDFAGNVLFRHKGNTLRPLMNRDRNAVAGRPSQPISLSFLTIWDASEEGQKMLKGIVLNSRYEVVVDSTVLWTEFSCGKATFNGKNGAQLIDTLYRPLIPLSAGYSEIHHYGRENCVIVKKESLYGALRPDGTVIRPCIYQGRLNPYDSGFVFRMQCPNCMPDNRAGTLYILWNGDTLINDNYDLAMINTMGEVDFHGPITIKDKESGKYGIITHDSSVTIPCVYDCLGGINENRILFFRGDTAGYLDRNGKRVIVLDFPCYALSDFSDGRALVSSMIPAGRDDFPTGEVIFDGKSMKERRHTWIDTSGEIIANRSFDQVGRFINGVSLVTDNGERYLVDTTLTRLKVDGKYDYCSYFSQGFAVITDGKRYGLADSTGKVVVPVVYDEIQMEDYSGAGVKMRGSNGRYDGTYIQRHIPRFIEGGKIYVRKGEEHEFLTVPGAK